MFFSYLLFEFRESWCTQLKALTWAQFVLLFQFSIQTCVFATFIPEMVHRTNRMMLHVFSVFFFHELSVSIQHNMSVILTSAARYCSVARCLNLNKLFQWPAPPWQGSCWTTYKIVHENKWKNIWITVLLHIKSSVRMLIKDGTQLKCSQTISSFASIIASNKCLYNMKDFLTSNKKKISSFTLHTTVKQRFNVTKFFLFLLN